MISETNLSYFGIGALKKLASKYDYNPLDTREVKLSKHLILIISICCSFCGLAGSGIYYYFLGFGFTTILPLIFAIVIIPTIFISHYVANYKILVHMQIICISLVPALIQWNLGSIHNSGFVIAWCFLSPLGATMFLKMKSAKTWMVTFLLIIAVTVVLTPTFSTDGAKVTENAHILFYLINIEIPFLFVFFATTYFLTEFKRQKKQLFSLSVLESVGKEMSQFFKTANTPIFGIDNDGLVNEWNLTSEKITGFTKDEVVGKDLVKTYIIEEYQEEVKKVLDDALKGKETANYEFPLFTKDRERLMVLLNSSTRKNTKGEIKGVLVVGQDITKIDTLRTALKDNKQRLELVMESLSEVTWGRSLPDYQLQYISSSVTSMYGLPMDDWYGKPNLWLDSIHPDDKKRIHKENEVFFNEGVCEMEFKILAANKQIKDINRKVKIIKRADGTPFFMTGISRDITEQKKNKDQLKHLNNKLKDKSKKLLVSNSTLEIKISERTLKLNEALKKQQELSKLKSRFISVASHEFKTPLAVINFAAGSIKKYWPKMEPIMIVQKMNKIQDQVLHMSRLLDDILIIGETEANEKIPEPLHLNLGKFIEEIIEEVYDSCKRSHEIALIDNEELKNSTIFIDEKLGRSIFVNLLSNAIKFSPETKKVTIELSSKKNQIVISVTDSGIGIPKAELATIFNPFTRGENVALIEGSGLGLSIVKVAIDELGGEIIVKSTVGKGTTFLVRIPKIKHQLSS